MNMIILRIIYSIKQNWFLLLLPISLSASDYSIVFVHLGNTLPSYLPISLQQARLFNPDAAIYLIANKKALERDGNRLSSSINLVSCEELTHSKAHRDFSGTSTLDTRFRDGFWKKTTERFFYLDELMQSCNLTHVFHLEYDNMLYVNLGELLPIFKHSYKGIAAIFDNDDRCVPSFMYISKATHASLLTKYLTLHTPRDTNGGTVMGFDMNTIGSYRKCNSVAYIASLPIAPANYLAHTPLQKPTSNIQIFYNNIEHFNSIFDGAALGQYLGGIDPRNGPSKAGFINQDCIFNAAAFSYLWMRDQQGRNIPYLEYHGKRYRINNLHIHSKQLDGFKS